MKTAWQSKCTYKCVCCMAALLFCQQSLFARTQSKSGLRLNKSDKEIQSLLSSYANEPTIQQVQKQAIGHTRTHMDQTRSWQNRVRQAPWLPKLDVRFGQDNDTGTSVREEVGDADVFYTKDSMQWQWDIQTQWQLGHLIFNPQELHVARQTASHWELQQKALQQVTKIYFDRRKIQLQLELQPPKNQKKRMQQELAIMHLTAQLDRLTGGWFSQQLQHHRRNR
ncbi:MAG: hypothetical protein AAF320_01630 [Myxococcota bacterium]